MIPHTSALTERQSAFLEHIRKGERITHAARAVGVSQPLHYHWLKSPEYADAFRQADAEGGDYLCAEAERAARAWVARQRAARRGRLVRR